MTVVVDDGLNVLTVSR